MGRDSKAHDGTVSVRRRKYLYGLIAGGVLPGITGCIGDGEGDGNGDADGGGGDGNGDADGGGGDGNGDGGSPNYDFELTFLSWNIGYHENAINGWMDDFTSMDQYSNIDMNWVDKPGSDLPTYLQSQIQGGNPPHTVDTQSSIYARYASGGVFAPLGPIINDRVDGGMSTIEEKFGEKILDFSKVDGTLFRLPFFHSTSWTGYRKKWFDEAGVEPPSTDNPYTTDQYFDVAEEVVNNSGADHGLVMLTFGFHFWPFFMTEGIDLLNDDNTAAAFNTDRTVEILSRFQELTDTGVIAETSFTGRWNDPNQTFASGNTAMNFAHFNNLRPIRANGDWVNEDTLGVAAGPRNQGIYAAHGWGIIGNDFHPQEEINATFDFINKVVLSKKWQRVNATAGPTRPVANLEAHNELANDEEFRNNQPILAKQYDIWSDYKDQAWAPPAVGGSGSIEVIIDKDMVSAAALGEKSPEQAVADAEQMVNEALANN